MLRTNLEYPKKFIAYFSLVFFSFFIASTAKSQVVINELGIAPTTGNGAGGGEFIELYNKGAASVNIGCYVVVFTGSSSAQGWTISIPANTILTCGQYYLIGGAGNAPSPTTNWVNTITGGNPWVNNYGGTNGITTITAANGLNINAAKCSGKGNLPPGNLADSKGQVSLLNSSGTVVGSVSFNSGNYSSLYSGSFSNAPTGCTGLNPIPNIPDATANVNGSFSGSSLQGIYLDDNGIYQTETDLTPGKSNALNGGTQIGLPVPTITLTSTAGVCFNTSSQTTALSYSGTTNNPDTYSITWNAVPTNSFAAVSNAALPTSPINITIPANTAAGNYTGTIVVKNACGQVSAGTNFTVTVNAAPTINTVPNQSVCRNLNTTAINFSGTGTAMYNWTNNTPSIGLAASGTGNIASFTALNSGSSPVTATITATPVSTGFAYVANYGTYPFPAGNTVSVINTTTNLVTSTITVGNNPFGVAVSPDGSKVYVTNYGSNSVSVISTSTNTVIATVAVGSQPMGVAVTPDGTKVYVVNQNLLGNPGTVSVIDAATNTVVATVPVYLRPLAIAISPDGTKVYVASVNSDNVTVINTATNTVATVIAVGVQPTAITTSPDGSRLYVTNFATNNVSVINTSTNTVVTTTSVGSGPNGAAVSPDGTKVYITNQQSNNVSVINTATNSVATTIAVGGQPHGISFTSDGSKAYVANFTTNNVSVINASTNAVINTVTVGTSPRSLGNFITPSSGCTGTPTTFTITVGIPPTAIYSYPSTTYCATGTATPTIVGTQGGAFSGSGSGLVIDATTGVVDLVASTPGSYTPKYNVTVGGCNLTVTANITIFALPSVLVVSTAPSTCSTPTGSITITSPIGAYTYSIDGTNFQSSPIFNNLSANTYTVTVKNADGCVRTTTTTVSGGSAVPAPVITIFTQPNCGEPTGLVIVTSPIGSNYTYSVDGVNFQSSTNFVLFPGTYTLTVKDAVSGCINTKPNIVINQSPLPITYTTTPSSCSTGGTITVTSPVGATALNYSINGQIPYQTSPIFTNLAPGNYSITVNTTFLCTNTINVIVGGTQYPVAVPVSSVVQPTCTTPTGSITITSPIGTGLTYSIDGTNFQTSTTFTNLVPNTYTVTVKNASGCTNTRTDVINSPSSFAAPIPTITQPTCTTPTGSINVTSPLGANYTYSINGTTFQSSTSFTNLVPNTYTLTAKDIVSGCTNSSTFTINTPPVTPAAPTVTSPVNYCQNATATALTATGSNLLWYTVASGGTGSSTAPTPSTSTVTTTNYYVSQTTGCESARSLIAVTVNANPSILATTVVQPTCAVPTGSITVNSPTGTGFTYSIDGTTFQSSTSFTNLAPNTYTVTVKNASGCTNTRTDVINSASSFAAPVPSITQPTCTTATGSINVTSPLGANYSYSIDGINFQASTSFTNIVPNTYTLTAKDIVSGCTNSSTFTINSPTGIPPAPTVTSPISYCQNATATALTAIGSNLLWYTVASGGTGSSTAPTPSTAAVGTTNYYVSQTTGCESPRSLIAVTINALPATPTITGNTFICTGGTSLFQSSSSFNNQWNLNGVPITGVNASSAYLASIAGNYTVTVTNANGCTATSVIKTLTVNPVPPAPTVVSPIYYCENATATALTATGILSNGNALWYIVPTGGAGSSIPSTPNTNVVGSTDYYVAQILNNIPSCVSSRSTITVIVSAAPAAPTVTSPVNYCLNETATPLTANGTNLLWYNVSSGGTGSANAPTPSTNSVGSINYYVAQILNNTGSCLSSRATITVTVAAAPAAPTVTSPINYCLNETATALTANGTNLLWYNVANGGTGSSNAPTPSTTTVSNTNYYVSQSNNNCESPRANILVNVLDKPITPTITANSTTTFCEGQDVTLTSSSSTSNQWYKDGVLLNGETNATYTATQTGSYTVLVSNAANCTAVSNATVVTVFPKPIVYAGPDVLVYELDSARLLGSATVGTVFSYLWTPSIYLSNDTIAQPWVVMPKVDGYYTLTVTNENGCFNDDQVFVKVQKELIIPNAFSPNGDGINDKWIIPNLDTYPYCKVDVFARSGQSIYSSVGYTKPWDGTYNGKPVPVGVYYYIINTGRGIKSGSLTVLR